MIDFSAIPNPKKIGGPWHSLKWAVIISFGFLGITAVGALITEFVGHRDTILPLISGVLCLIYFGFIILAFIKGFKGFQKQKQWMWQFARDNGWQYDESKRTVRDLVAYPPLYASLASGWSKVRCTVSGELEGSNFDLAHITYIQSTGLIGAVLGSRSRFAWTSVLRIEGHPNLSKNSDFIYEIDSSYTYVICGLNALYRSDIKAMFDSVTGPRKS